MQDFTHKPSSLAHAITTSVHTLTAAIIAEQSTVLVINMKSKENTKH